MYHSLRNMYITNIAFRHNMTKDKFSEIIKGILIPSINKTTEAEGGSASRKIGDELKNIVYELEQAIHNKYEEKKDEFKVKLMREGKNSLLNRHKIAALFYFGFIDIMEESSFLNTKNIEENEFKRLFMHNVAFNTAIGIVEAFIRGCVSYVYSSVNYDCNTLPRKLGLRYRAG